MNSMCSSVIGGLPTLVLGPDSFVQYALKRRRFYLSTVSGLTITNPVFHSAQILDNHTQTRRSPSPILALFTVRLYTASC